MRFQLTLVAALFFLSIPNLFAQGTPVDVWSDPSAKYWIVGNDQLTGKFRLISTRRVGRSGESWAIRLADCSIPKFAYLGDASTFSQAQSQAWTKEASCRPTSAHQTMESVCKKNRLSTCTVASSHVIAFFMVSAPVRPLTAPHRGTPKVDGSDPRCGWQGLCT